GTRGDYILTYTRGEPNFIFKHNARLAHLIILEASPNSDSDSMLDLNFSNNIKPHYEGARGRGTRGDYNLFKLILGVSLI
ncbi:hypothetical protein GIB67_040382, partial [Kingdonia uniflora]